MYIPRQPVQDSHAEKSITNHEITHPNDLDPGHDPDEVMSGEKIDWNDYDLMARDKIRLGPGEHGQPCKIPLTPEGMIRSRELSDKHKFNVTVSAAISLERSIGDSRDHKCQQQLFRKDIPRNSVSVIIIFHDEHDTTILRTVHSVVNRSPPRLLKEVVLVDDASTLKSLKKPLDDYVARKFTKVRVIHSKERLGLSKSRIVGADNTTGEFLIIIDGHIEVNYNFLPPLLEPMVEDYRTIACPVVDIIDREDFRITTIPPERNAFSWTMRNEHLPIFEKDRANLPEPYNTPVMLGCALAITRRWWEMLGKFDPGFKVWGEEQYELSFKTWMCGGRMVDVPCSRMAHLFRNALPYSMEKGTLGSNIARLALVWMDEYKNYVYQRLPKLKEIDPGDISGQLDLRRRLQCKSFHWYMTNIAPDILWNWPVVEPPLVAWGVIKSEMAPDICMQLTSVIDTGMDILLHNCNEKDLSYFMNTLAFELNWRDNIKSRFGKLCLAVPYNNKVLAHNFRLNATGQQFGWNRQNGWLVNVGSGLCLQANMASLTVDLAQCVNGDQSLRWSFQHYNATLVDAAWICVKKKLMERNVGKIQWELV